MNHKELIKLTYLQEFVIVIILFCSIGIQPLRAQEKNPVFTFKSIAEIEFRNALKNNYNASFITKIADSTKLEKALENRESANAYMTNVDPIFNSFHEEPRFIEIRKKMQYYE